MKSWILLFFCIYHTAAAQASEVLSRRLDVTFRQAPIQEALDKVAQLAKFEWSYDASIIDKTKRISLVVNDWTVREILYEILGDAYKLKTNGNYVILKRQNKPPKEVIGYLKDPQSGQRITNATVYDRRTLRATTTDSSGFYRLKVKKSSEIMITRLGYRDTILTVSSTVPRFQKIDLTPIDTSGKEPTPKEAITLAIQNAASDLERFFEANLDKWHSINVEDSLSRRYQISLLPYLGTNHTLSGKVTNHWSLNVIAGHSYAVKKLEIGGVANFTRQRVDGIQVAGALNILRGSCSGIQVAGVYNAVGDTLEGVQVAGVSNWAFSTKGFAIQTAGLVNFGGKNEKGIIQVAGMANFTEKINAAQVAGLINRADEVTGVQIAGLVNTTDTLTGVQVSIFNHAHKVRGIQIGLINTAKEVNGLQIGLLNRSGRRWRPLFNW